MANSDESFLLSDESDNRTMSGYRGSAPEAAGKFEFDHEDFGLQYLWGLRLRNVNFSLNFAALLKIRDLPFWMPCWRFSCLMQCCPRGTPCNVLEFRSVPHHSDQEFTCYRKGVDPDSLLNNGEKKWQTMVNG